MDARSRSENKIPSLDLSKLRKVTEFKDWFPYTQKLENCVKFLRQRV
jgi:hypothetical protein